MLLPNDLAQRSALWGRSSGKNQIFLILFLFVFLAGNGVPGAQRGTQQARRVPRVL